MCLHDEGGGSEAGAGGKRPDSVFSVRQLGQEGNTSVFRCPYHAWTYDLTGKLVSVPGAEKFAPAGFNLADHSLHPAHVRVAGGFIFVSLAAGAAPEFQVPVGGVEPKLKVAARRTHHVKGNWKLVLENFTECYHCGIAHTNSYVRGDWVGDETLTPAQVAALGGNYDDYLAAALHGYTWKPDKTQVAPSGGMGARGRHQAGAAVNYGLPLRPGQVAMTVDGKPACAKLLPGYTERLGAGPGRWAAEVGGLLSFMNGVIPSPDYALIWRFIPRAVDKTDADLIWLVHPDAEEGKDYDVEHLVALWNNTVREDRWVVENNHVGLSNSRYSGGQPYMPSEIGLVNITDFYMNQMVPAMLRAETKKGLRQSTARGCDAASYAIGGEAMSEDKTCKEDGITTKNNLTRRDLALTSLAMGAAAVLPATGTAQGSQFQYRDSGVSSSAEAGAAPNRSVWKRGGTIPAEYYLDEKWYARDEHYLKENYWWVVDHEDRIPEPGDYFLFQFGRGDSIIIARDDKGGVNAFHNVCRHRGSRVCLHDENLPSEAGAGGKRPDAVFSVRQLGQDGNTSVFRCPYHAWTYDLTGKLVSVPGAANFAPEGFSLADHSLHPAHVRVAGGFIL